MGDSSKLAWTTSANNVLAVAITCPFQDDALGKVLKAEGFAVPSCRPSGMYMAYLPCAMALFPSRLPGTISKAALLGGDVR